MGWMDGVEVDLTMCVPIFDFRSPVIGQINTKILVHSRGMRNHPTGWWWLPDEGKAKKKKKKKEGGASTCPSFSQNPANEVLRNAIQSELGVSQAEEKKIIGHLLR